MSLVADILFNRPIALPKGRCRTHNPDERRRQQQTTQAMADNAARNTATKQANIERVYNAIAAGVTTLNQVKAETGLSHTTVCYALKDLEGAKRITRIKGVVHRFEVKGTP